MESNGLQEDADCIQIQAQVAHPLVHLSLRERKSSATLRGRNQDCVQVTREDHLIANSSAMSFRRPTRHLAAPSPSCATRVFVGARCC